MARLEAPLSAFGCVPVWMIDDGAATNFFGRKNSYSLVRFVLAGPGRRWDTQQESLIIPWNGWLSHFSLTPCFSSLGEARPWAPPPTHLAPDRPTAFDRLCPTATLSDPSVGHFVPLFGRHSTLPSLFVRKFFGARRAYIAQSLLTSYGR